MSTNDQIIQSNVVPPIFDGQYKSSQIFFRKRPDAFVTDFKTDFDMDMIWTDLFGGQTQVHRGFYERYRKMRKEILKVVNEYGNTKRYCSVGHSLGAALAIFTTLELRMKKLDAWAFLLAPPKVGSESFNQLVKANIPKDMIVRVVRTNDFLPKLSPIPPYSVRLKVHGHKFESGKSQ